MLRNIFLLSTIGLLAVIGQARAEVFTVEMVTDASSDQVYFFKPNDLVIKLGDTVTFVNGQNDFHNVMFDSVPENVVLRGSPMLESVGDSWSYIFTVEGTYSFHCHPHAGAGMKGTIVVGKPSKNKPSASHNHQHGDHLH